MSLATKNAFAALAGDKKSAKKSSSKSSKDKKDKKKKAVSTDELEKAIFSQPSINISSWADEDDDDYSVPVLPSNWQEEVGWRSQLLEPLTQQCVPLHALSTHRMRPTPRCPAAGARSQWCCSR